MLLLINIDNTQLQAASTFPRILHIYWFHFEGRGPGQSGGSTRISLIIFFNQAVTFGELFKWILSFLKFNSILKNLMKLEAYQIITHMEDKLMF